jgi:hypothetical protein
MVHPSQRPYNLYDIYDWEVGLMDGDEDRSYHAIPKLWPIGKVSPKELNILPEEYVGMAQHEKNINYLL